MLASSSAEFTSAVSLGGAGGPDENGDVPIGWGLKVRVGGHFLPKASFPLS